MPGFNGKGPEGQGSQTGRGMGKCNKGNGIANETEFARGRGRKCRKAHGNENSFKNKHRKGQGLRKSQ